MELFGELIMTKEADLIKLEGIVTNLMERYNTLKLQKIELKAQIKAKDDKISELNNELETLQDEKSNVHGRVSNLLGSIEEWEKTLDSDEKTDEIVLSSMDDSTDQEVTETKLF